MKDHPPERIHHELTAEILERIVEECIEEKKNGGNSCLIIDDFSEQLKSKQIEKSRKKILFKHTSPDSSDS